MTGIGWINTAQNLTLPALAGSAFLLGLVAFIRVLPQLRRVQMENDAGLRGDLLARIAALETANERDREACEERVARVEERAEIRLAAVEARLEGEVQILRHERNNVRQAINMLFSRIKRLNYPELQEIVAEVEEMLSRGDEVIAVEKAALPSVRANARSKL